MKRFLLIALACVLLASCVTEGQISDKSATHPKLKVTRVRVTQYVNGNVMKDHTDEIGMVIQPKYTFSVWRMSKKYGLVEIEETVSHEDYDRFEIGDVYR